MFDRREKLYKCWYFTRIKEWARDITRGSPATEGKGPGNLATLYAVSKDGIKWEKPELDVYRYKGNPTNIVVYGAHGTGVFKDPRDLDPGGQGHSSIETRPAGGAGCLFRPDGCDYPREIRPRKSQVFRTEHRVCRHFRAIIRRAMIPLTTVQRRGFRR